MVASIVDEELLVQQAQRDTSIQVTDQEIADGVEQQVRKVRANFNVRGGLQNELKKAGFETPEEYRRWLTDQQRRAAFQNRLIDKLRQRRQAQAGAAHRAGDAGVLRRAEGQPRLASGHDLVPPDRHHAARRSPAAKARTRAQADSILLELRRGADFATAAKRFSQDPGSKDQGGSLNWFRRGVMVPEFERVAFSLKPGVVSDPVESPFGYHLIQVERVQPGEVQARHILLVPDIDSITCDSARALADSVRETGPARAHRSTRCSGIYHDPSAEKQAENVPADKLPENYAKVDRRGRLRAVAPVFTLPGSRATSNSSWCRSPAAVRRATSATRTCATAFASSSASSSRSGGTSTGCGGRRTWTSGRSDPVPDDPARHHARRPARHRARDRGARARPSRSTRRSPLVGADDQIAGVPAARRVGRAPGGWAAASARTTARAIIRAGRLAGHAVETAVKLALAGEVDAIVTAPAHKHALHLAGFPYPGHTEWLAQLAGDVDVAMMLASAELRVVLVTTHVPFRDVPALLTVERVTRAGRITQQALRDWWGIDVAAARGLRGQSARGRERPLRRRGGAGARPAARGARRGRAAAGGHGLRAGDAGRVRRGARAVSRRGDDGHQGGRRSAGR